MKKFIAKILLFIGVVGCLLGGLCAVVLCAEVSAYRRELVMPADTSIVVCGDSQTAHALDPSLWPELFNFSLDGSLLDQSRMKLSDILCANSGRIRVILLDISPWKFYVGNPCSALIDEGSAAQQVLIHILHYRENIRPLHGFIKMFRDVILVKKGRKLHRLFFKRRPYKSSLCGGYVRIGKAGFLDAPDHVERNIRRISEGINMAPKAGTGAVAFDEWEKTLSVVASARVEKVVLITTPFHPRLREAIEKERLDDFKRETRAFAEKVGCSYFDFLELPIPDIGWRDANHLNEIGAEIFTQACRKAILQ